MDAQRSDQLGGLFKILISRSAAVKNVLLSAIDARKVLSCHNVFEERIVVNDPNFAGALFERSRKAVDKLLQGFFGQWIEQVEDHRVQRKIEFVRVHLQQFDVRSETI